MSNQHNSSGSLPPPYDQITDAHPLPDPGARPTTPYLVHAPVPPYTPRPVFNPRDYLTPGQLAEYERGQAPHVRPNPADRLTPASQRAHAPILVPVRERVQRGPLDRPDTFLSGEQPDIRETETATITKYYPNGDVTIIKELIARQIFKFPAAAQGRGGGQPR